MAKVVKSEETVLAQIYLNKLWIPDVLIDIIKDYLYGEDGSLVFTQL